MFSFFLLCLELEWMDGWMARFVKNTDLACGGDGIGNYYRSKSDEKRQVCGWYDCGYELGGQPRQELHLVR